jgi:hypothetical protein
MAGIVGLLCFYRLEVALASRPELLTFTYLHLGLFGAPQGT